MRRPRVRGHGHHGATPTASLRPCSFLPVFLGGVLSHRAPILQTRRARGAGVRRSTGRAPGARSRRWRGRPGPTCPPSVRRAMPRPRCAPGRRSGSLSCQARRRCRSRGPGAGDEQAAAADVEREGVQRCVRLRCAARRRRALDAAMRTCSRRWSISSLLGELELDEPAAVGGHDDRLRADDAARGRDRRRGRPAPARIRAGLGSRVVVATAMRSVIDRLDARSPRSLAAQLDLDLPVPGRRPRIRGAAGPRARPGRQGARSERTPGRGRDSGRPSAHGEVDERAEVVRLVGVGDEQRGRLERREGADAGLLRDGARDGGRTGRRGSR